MEKIPLELHPLQGKLHFMKSPHPLLVFTVKSIFKYSSRIKFLRQTPSLIHRLAASVD